jgi:hypothetical protein
MELAASAVRIGLTALAMHVANGACMLGLLGDLDLITLMRKACHGVRRAWACAA